MFDEQGNLVGMLTRPLRQRGGAAEVQVMLQCLTICLTIRFLNL